MKYKTFEAFDNKDYDEAYDELREANEPMVYDFAFSQDYEYIDTFCKQMSDREITDISLNVESVILKNLKKFLNGNWTADSGSHGQYDEMYASVYLQDDDTTISKTQYMIDCSTNSDYIQEDDICVIIQAIKPIKQYFVTPNDVQSLSQQMNVRAAEIMYIVNSFSFDVTISNPTDKILELFE